MRTVRSALSSLGRSPAKAAVMLATVGLGVAVLIFALSISTAFGRLISERLEGNGLVVTVRVTDEEGDGEPVDSNGTVDTLLHDIVGAAAASPVAPPMTPRFFVVGQTTYEIRDVLGVWDAYLEVMQLDVIAGRRFSAGSRDALISASLAEILFGSPVAALGQPLQTAEPRIAVQGASGAALVRGDFMRLYTVRGVFADPDELRRRAYGIADMLVPLSVGTPFLVLRVEGRRFATVESQVRSALAAQLRSHTVEVWEGHPLRMGSALEEARSTVRTFAVVVNLLGALLLATGGVGILSLMTVEVLSRSRQIALSRAFGAAKAAIVREFLARSLIMMGASSALGVALSLFLSAPLTELVVPIFQDVTEVELTGPVITPAAVVAGVAASLGIGGLLGTLPVFSALSAPIAEGIRD
ncbi:MAG: ABC transporter permease [Spirochaetaceae bacterium]|nr:ABC transporter permease [Spirochaetaceae bacterium]